MELFGAIEGSRLEPEQTVKSEETTTKSLLNKVTHLGLSKKSSIDTLRTNVTTKEDETASTSSAEKVPPTPLVNDSEHHNSALRFG